MILSHSLSPMSVVAKEAGKGLTLSWVFWRGSYAISQRRMRLLVMLCAARLRRPQTVPRFLSTELALNATSIHRSTSQR